MSRTLKLGAILIVLTIMALVLGLNACTRVDSYELR